MSRQTQVNGTSSASKFIDSIDPDDPEYLRQLQRPAEVKQDVRQMEDRRRVKLVLNSKAFRNELERLVDERMKSGEPVPPSLIALQQQISTLFLPQARLKHGALFGQGNGPVRSINDFRTDDAIAGYAKGEKVLRCKVASSYRLVDIFGWSQNASGMITARVNSEDEHYLVAPTGVLFSDVTASGLVKVDALGSVVDAGPDARLAPNRAVFTLLGLLHSARPDLKAVFFLSNPSVVSVSAMNFGLLPLCVDAMALGNVPFLDGDVQLEQLRESVGSVGKVVFIKNKGVLIGGESVEEAFHVARSVMNAVDTQLRTLPLGLENIVLPSAEAQQRAYNLANQVQQTPAGAGDAGSRKWHRGELEFEAMMRRLENAGYRTGYPFHDSLVRKVERLDRVNADVEVPPTLTAVAMPGDDGSAEKVQKNAPRVDWVNSSKAYKKEEIDVPGAPRVKKITKWVQDTAPGSVIKIESPNQFAPIGADPKELKTKFHQIRRDYYDENITCGPQSRILEGVTWEEAQKIKEGNVKSDTIIVVGAASRGVIQRGHETEAAVFKTYYAPNPFDNVTEEDVEQYRAEIKKKSGHADESLTATEDEVLSPGPEGHLISTQERMQQIREQMQSASPPPDSADVDHSPRVIEPPKVSHSYVEPERVEPKRVEPERVDLMAGGEPQPMASASLPRGSAKPISGHTTEAQTDVDVGSPAKSTTSADAGGTTSATSPVPTTAEGTPEKKHKKKRGFRMPSFSSKKKEK